MFGERARIESALGAAAEKIINFHNRYPVAAPQYSDSWLCRLRAVNSLALIDSLIARQNCGTARESLYKWEQFKTKLQIPN